MTADLTSGEAHLFMLRAPESLPPELVAEYERLVTPVEHKRYKEFRFDRHRHSFLLTRVLVRLVLSHYTDTAPNAWRFSLGSHGKPQIESPPPPFALNFNLSNTEGMVVCLVARDIEVGVNVEHTERHGELDSIAERFFSPREVDDLRALPKPLQQDRFFAYWTLKEAYIKARGLGLAIPLDQFSFLLDEGDGIRIETDPRLGDDPSLWQFGCVPVDGPHALAFALRRERRPGFSLKVKTCVATRIENFL